MLNYHRMQYMPASKSEGSIEATFPAFLKKAGSSTYF